jgi:hypothetical protein
MLDQIQGGLYGLKTRNLILYQIYSVIAVIILVGSLFTVLDNSPGFIQDDQDYFASASSSDPQIICSIPQSNLLEIIKPKKTQSYPDQVFSTFLKSLNYARTQAPGCPPGYYYTCNFNCQQIYLLLDLPPPSLL